MKADTSPRPKYFGRISHKTIVLIEKMATDIYWVLTISQDPYKGSFLWTHLVHQAISKNKKCFIIEEHIVL